MRAYHRRPSGRRGRNDGSFWLSFSDLMSSVVLIIILVMFYFIYQYFNLAELKEAEIAEHKAQLTLQQSELEKKQSELTAAQEELTTAQDELTAAQLNLTTAQEELTTAQGELSTAQGELSSAQNTLALQQAQLASQQLQLDERDKQLEQQQATLTQQQTTLTQQQTTLAEQQAQLEYQQQQIEALVGMKTRIIASLSEALRSNGISAKVDSTTGSIALASDLLFDSGKFDLSEAGKDFIDSFLPVYLDVLFSGEYYPYVSEIIIEGHTDSDGAYLDNLKLSQQRALAVAGYVLGEECRTVSWDQKNTLRPVVTVNGRGYSDRIFNSNGTENKDASRRVVIKFRLTDEQMINQLRLLLEG